MTNKYIIDYTGTKTKQTIKLDDTRFYIVAVIILTNGVFVPM